jgi:hypothetical protein
MLGFFTLTIDKITYSPYTYIYKSNIKMGTTKEKSQNRIIQEMIDEQWMSQVSEKSNMTYEQIQELNNLFTINEGKYSYR